jgi:hypothetical protein
MTVTPAAVATSASALGPSTRFVVEAAGPSKTAAPAAMACAAKDSPDITRLPEKNCFHITGERVYLTAFPEIRII